MKDDGKAGKDEYTCGLCSKVFFQPKLFERHKFEEHDRKICGCCGKFYEDFEEFYQHLPHICEYCGKHFKTNGENYTVDDEDCSEELLRQQCNAIKKQASKAPRWDFGT